MTRYFAESQTDLIWLHAAAQKTPSVMVKCKITPKAEQRISKSSAQQRNLSL